MRVTQFTYINNFVNLQQKQLTELSKKQMQISSGKKINNIYDDPTVYIKDLGLKEEINGLDQVNRSASFAQTFARETDTTINDIVTTLGSFKTKLLAAANDTENITSREAIVSELTGMLEHLKDLANTSIDGKYIFSGSAFDTKAIGDDLKYHGNDQKVKAFLGAGVEREYNIPGSEIFLGKDSDYKKHMTVNVVQYDKMKANPEFVVRGKDGKLYIDKHLKDHGKAPDAEDVPVNEPVTNQSEIRMLTGVEDKYDSATDTYTDGISYFYIKGRKPNGESFNSKFSLKNSASVDQLLTKIGEAYGNTATSKVVEVTLNDMGEIQVKDVASGKMTSDFFMVATDENPNASQADKDNGTAFYNSFEDVVKNGAYVVEFQKSDFNTIRDANTIKASNQYFDNRVFEFASDFKLLDGSRYALNPDLLKNVFGTEGLLFEDTNADGINDNLTQTGSVDFIRLYGKDTDGNDVDVNIQITDTTTMDDLIKTIKNNFGDVNVKLDNGKIVITDNTLEEKNDSSKMQISMQTYNDTDGDGTLELGDDKLVNALRRSDFTNEDKIYLDSQGTIQQGNVSQITRDGYRHVNVYDKNGNKIDVREELIENPQYYADDKTRIADVAGYEDPTELDGREFVVNFLDKDGNYKRAVITLRDTPYTDASGNEHYSTFWVDENNDGVRDDNEVYDIFGENADELTPANDRLVSKSELDPVTCKVCNKEERTTGMTYEQLNNVISLLVTGKYQDIDNTTDQETEFKTTKDAITAAQQEVDIALDDKGRLKIEDLHSSPSKIRVSIFDKTASETGEPSFLTFQSNDAITIDEPAVDFFETLQKSIDAVKNGRNFADGDSPNPRSYGIQGAIEAIDHVMDHVRRSHAHIGAVSNEFNMTIERVETLKVHVQTLQSDNIDTDIGEASMELNALQLSYQGLLASISKVNKLTLLNYL
ncbi:MAG: flagellar hook-associated protein FlgL [Epsilonproteobacteria bacterium]|nr:flagellar hook-associated protein FlgL [Campylobacterota bacterium]